MSVDSTTRKQSYDLDGATEDFDFTFRAFTNTPTDIKCIVSTNDTLTALTYRTNYTVSINSDGVGGTVSLISAATIGLGTLIVYRETTNKQESDYDDYDQFPANTLEADIDRRTLISQEVAEEVARCIKLGTDQDPDTVSPTLPAPSADALLGWNSDGTGIENKVALDADIQAACEAAQAACEDIEDNLKYGAVEYPLDGGGSVIDTGIVGDIQWPNFDATIIRAAIYTTTTAGTLVIDLWKDTFANHPPTDADSITGSTPPTITGGTAVQDTVLTGWTTSITARDIIRVNVDACTTYTTALLVLEYERSI